MGRYCELSRAGTFRIKATNLRTKKSWYLNEIYPYENMKNNQLKYLRSLKQDPRNPLSYS
jgi:hypothetical protein